jgi:integrase
MARHQRGYIYEASSAFHVRYYVTEIVEGKPLKKQRSHRLCTKDRSTGHGSPSAMAVRSLCEDFMRTINTDTPSPSALSVVDFWEHTYLPFITENLKPSTRIGYQQVWNQHLKDHFGNMTLREYRKGIGSLFLTKLAKKYSQRTVQHIKNLASGIFTHAANLDLIEANPWSFCKVLGKSKATAPTQHYTLEEIENIITALVDHVDCQLIMALTFFMGLRKGEIQALQWGDIDEDYIHVRRNITRGHITTPKTKKSVRSIPIIQPVKGLLRLWRAKATTEDVWVFKLNLVTVARKTIRPVLAKNKLDWKGFHAGRRGLGTTLRALTGNSTAARDVLGHEDETLTKDHYEGKLPEEALKGMRLLEQKSLNGGK